MQEHPVPQNVTGYEFHLIGQMTLKQFMEVAVGVVAAVLIYWTNLPTFFKYPLMAFVGLLGVGLAFVPLEGRPLDRWFLAFIRSIYQPTMFFWKKTNTVPEAFTYTQPKDIDKSPNIDYTPMRQSRLQEYVHTVNAPAAALEKDAEALAADEVIKLFSAPQITPSKPTTEEPPTPSILPKTTGTIVPVAAPIVVETRMGVTPDLVAPIPTDKIPLPVDSLHTFTSAPAVQNTDTLVPIQTLVGFPFPNKPTNPNMLSGMVVTSDEKIVENAILTITRISDNTPVRAIKTNTLGQFAVVTPLENGKYALLIEKDGLRFDKYSLVLNNQVIEPILIKATT